MKTSVTPVAPDSGTVDPSAMKLLVISNMWPGPRKPYFGVFVETRVQGYVEAGVDVTVMANRDPRRGPLWGLLKYTGLLLRSVWSVLRRRPDVVEGHYLVPTAVITAITAKIGRCPYVLYAHGSDLAPPRAIGGFVARAVAGAAEIHTNSEDSRARLEARFPGQRAEVIPVGVDLARFPVGSPKRDPIVAFVGNLDSVKGPDVLLRALGLLRRTNWTCRIAGIGPLRDDLIALANSLNIADRIDWLGAVAPERVGVFYRDARVTVVPSRRDALGQVAIEALASGTPVVVSGVGGLRSIPTADCGSVVPPDDPLTLSVAIEQWLEQPFGPPTVAAARKRAAGYDAAKLAEQATDRLRVIAKRGA